MGNHLFDVIIDNLN